MECIVLTDFFAERLGADLFTSPQDLIKISEIGLALTRTYRLLEQLMLGAGDARVHPLLF
jgi:hypothetical protein